MAAMLTATPVTLADGAPPSLGINLTGVAAGAPVQIERHHRDLGWQPVRGGTGSVAANGAFYVIDWAAPINHQADYRALVNGQLAASAQGFLNGQQHTWLQDAFQPRVGVRIRIDELGPAWGHNAFRTAQWHQPISSAQVLGASLPTDSIGVRSRVANTPITIHAEKGTQTNLLRELLQNAGTLLVRGAPTDLLPATAFIAIPDLAETQHGHPAELVTFTGTVRLTAEPSHAITIPTWTWAQVRDLARQRIPGATFAQVAAATPHTFQEVADNPNRVANHGVE